MLAGSLSATVFIEEFRLSVEGPATVRPGESFVIQVRAFGRLEQEGRETRKGRVDPSNWKIRAVEDGGGWFSKPFRFQGSDKENILREEQTGWKSVLGGMAGQFTNKDSVLYTASKKPGNYTIEVSGLSDGKSITGQLQVKVAADAKERFVPVANSFGPEKPDTDRYHKLAERYAPYVAQETWFDPRADYICRFDFDGDWDGVNNWDNLEKGSPQGYVYYTAVETSTHWFLHYSFFHARDYSDNCIAGTCHENDNEGIIFTVLKDDSEYGRIEIMETLAHNNVYTYTNRRDLRAKLHNIDGPLELVDETHPVVFLEAGGHGALGGGDKKIWFDSKRRAWRQNTGVTYKYKGVAEVPVGGGMDSDIGYELLPIFDHWWTKHQQGEAWKERTFADYMEYRPFGNRPRPENPRIASAFAGVKHSANKARPFWGWFDMKGRSKKVLAPGQWALDPAYSVFQSLTFPRNEQWSMDYTYNPYLGFQ